MTKRKLLNRFSVKLRREALNRLKAIAAKQLAEALAAEAARRRQA